MRTSLISHVRFLRSSEVSRAQEEPVFLGKVGDRTGADSVAA